MCVCVCVCLERESLPPTFKGGIRKSSIESLSTFTQSFHTISSWKKERHPMLRLGDVTNRGQKVPRDYESDHYESWNKSYHNCFQGHNPIILVREYILVRRTSKWELRISILILLGK